MGQILPFRRRSHDRCLPPIHHQDMTADEAYSRWGFDHAPLRFAGIDTLVASINAGLDEGTLGDIDSCVNLSNEFIAGCSALDRYHQREAFGMFADLAARANPSHAVTLKRIGDLL